jgi:NAD+-dependent protein deacetylase SIR2
MYVSIYEKNCPLIGERIADLSSSDIIAQPDMLIVIGTTLKVHGLKKLLRSFSNSMAPSCKVVVINKTPLTKEWDSVFDMTILGECDNVVELIQQEMRTLDRNARSRGNCKFKLTSLL